MVFSVLISGCAPKEITKEIIVTKPVYINIPVKCELPEPTCNSNQKTYTEIITEMQLCINRYKEVYKLCAE